MVVSSEAVARLKLSDDQAMSDKPSVCPAKFRMNSPVSGDHSLATVSAPVGNPEKARRGRCSVRHSSENKIGKQ